MSGVAAEGLEAIFVHVLVVEDDGLMADGLLAGLRMHGLTVDAVATAAHAEAAVAASRFDACVLDLGLPDGDGLNLLSRWRTRGQDLPILILTARDAVEHRVRGLHGGADDYLLKPFDLAELVARLYAITRRAAGRCVNHIQHGRLTCDPSAGQVWLDGEMVELSRREWTLLQALLLHPRRILTAGQLHDSLYGFEDVASNALNVHIHHLRRKLGPNVVETVRGLGYRLGEAGA